MLEIIQIPLLSDNYSYIIIDKNTNTTGCIDPSVAKEGCKYIKEKRNWSRFHFEYSSSS